MGEDDFQNDYQRIRRRADRVQQAARRFGHGEGQDSGLRLQTRHDAQQHGQVCQPVGSFLSSAFLYEMSVVTAEEDDREFEQRRSVRRFRFLALEAQAQFYRVTAR